MANSERAECPECGRHVAVKRDGSLRKHECVEQPEAPAEDATAPEPVVEQPPEQSDAPVTRVPAPRKDPRLCAVADCDRPNVLHRLCGAHYASRRGDGN